MALHNTFRDDWKYFSPQDDPISRSDEVAVVGSDGVTRAAMADIKSFTDPSSVEFVTKPEHLGGVLDSNKVYMLDGIIEMGATQITVPQGGLVIQGFDTGLSGITTSESGHTLFIDDGTFSGALSLRNLFVTVSGGGAQVFGLDNGGNGNSIQLTNFNFIGCTSLGIIDNYRQALWSVVAVADCTDGVTLEGTWSGGVALLTTIIVDAVTPFSGTLLKKGSGLVINGSVRSDMNALGLAAGGSICDFGPSNITLDTGFLMDGVRVNPASDSFPNMPESSVKANFTNCVGTPNTHIGGQWSITSAVATDLTTGTGQNPNKLAGVTTYVDVQHFTGVADNAFTYIGTDKVSVVVSGVLGVSGTANDVVCVSIRHWDASAVSYVDISNSGGATMNAGGRAEGVSLEGIINMDTNDRVEIWVENKSADRNVTADVGGLVHVSRR